MSTCARVLATLVWCGGCRAAMTFDEPIPVDDTFPRVPATGEVLARYEAAAAYSEAHNGLAVLVLDGDDVVFETYQNGYDASTPHHVFSGTKTFSCATATLLDADGTLPLDATVASVLPEFADGGMKDRITVRELLEFTSGLDDAWWKLTWDGLHEHQHYDDKYAIAVALDANTEPGSAWAYGSQHLAVFGAAVTKAAGRDAVAVLDERVFVPIGFRYAGWNRDPAGNPMLAYGAWTTANEWAKYGALLRDDGVWHGTRVLPEGAVAACTHGSEANPAYGFATWLNRPVPDSVDLSQFRSLGDVHDGEPVLGARAPADLFAAAGAHDNRLYVMPAEHLVVVRLGDGDRGWNDEEFLDALLGTAP